MSNKSNSVAIGAFIVGALIISVSAILYISGSGWGQDRSKVVMVFDGSVKGLTVGAPIALRGVQIGSVTDIRLILDTNTIDIIMLVEAEIKGQNILQRGEAAADVTEALIARGMRAQLNSQSLLTGLLYVQLDFYPNSELVLVDIDSPYTQIPTIPTDLERLSRQFESIDFAEMAQNLKSMAEGLNAFITNPSFQSLPQDLQATLAAIESLGGQLAQQIEVTGPKLDTLVENTSATMQTVNREMPRLSSSATHTLAQLDATLAEFQQAMTEINHLVGNDSSTRYELDKALRELSLAGRAMQLLAKTLEEQPEALLRGKNGDRP
jgi:phospholipid/cholesterol/gamma-HCH transport system substrate-binding protein